MPDNAPGTATPAADQLALDVVREYIGTHLSGAAAATQTVERLAGRLGADELLMIHSDLQEEQQLLLDLLDTLEIPRSTLRRAAAAVGERIAEAPRRVIELAEPELRDLIDLEALIVGIAGKRALWRSLLAIRTSSPAIDALPLDSLEERGERQQHMVEALRVEAAKQALRKG